MEQLELIGSQEHYPVRLSDVFEAYYECRKNKRRTVNALKFEMNLEENLVRLWREINEGRYEIGRSMAFVVRHPVKREVFAADFRDRIVHHLVIRKLWPLLNQVISPHSYSCRPGMGTLYGIREVYQHVKKCSENYTRKCWVLKLDIRAFFMHIRHDKLYQMLSCFIKQNYHAEDKSALLCLVHKIIRNKPQDYCIRKGKLSDWMNLPKAKSLFHVKRGKGLPIGNLSSQIFANFYLKDFDAFVTKKVGGFYGRYVDDMILIHKSQFFLKIMLNKVQAYLWQNYRLVLHPRKIYLQPVYNGFSFVGAFLKCSRIYAGKRLKKMFYKQLNCLDREINAVLIRENPQKSPLLVKNRTPISLVDKNLANGREIQGILIHEAVTKEITAHALAVINSYLGFLKHYHTLRLRLKAWKKIQKTFPFFCLNHSAVKVFVRK